MNTAIATFAPSSPTSAVVEIKYTFSDGREDHIGFSTVDVDLPAKLYDACYNRAEALAKEQKCRLEKFSKAEYRVHLTNFQYYLDGTFDNIQQAKDAAVKAGFDCTITKENELIASWSILGGFKLL